jgi:hypothetical protein
MMQAAPLITEELLDEDFFAELDALIDKDFEENKEIQEENRNCGTGAVGGKQGFQPGNKCAGSGEKSKGKAEGKKKDVHSDWDDGKTAAEAGWEYWKSKSREYVPGVESWERSRNRFIVKNAVDDEEIDVRIVSSGSGEIHPRTLSFEVNGSQAVTGKGRGVAMKVIREVANRTTSLFQEDNVPGLIFTSDLDDGPGRAKLYKRMSEMLANKYDGISLAKPTLGGNLAFSVVKKSLWEEIKVKMADKTSSGYKWKKSKDLPVKKINDFFNPTDGLDFYDGDDVDEQWDQIPDNTGIYYRFMEVPDQVEKTYFFDELLNDESFMQEIERMFDSIENRNCGTGAVGGKQGFQPGNKCAGTGEKSKGKAEGKKKGVHSDWDDGKNAEEAGWNTKVWNKEEKKTETYPGIDRGETAKNQFYVKMRGYADVEGGVTPSHVVKMTSPPDGELTANMFDDEDWEFAAPRGLMFSVDSDMDVTNKGQAMTIIREVSNRAISLFEDPSVPGLEFSATVNDGIGRTKLYTTLAKKLAKKVPGSRAWVSEDAGSMYFFVTKKSSTQKFLEYMDTMDLRYLDDIIADGYDPRKYADDFPERK